ncbi:MAG: DNA internalization-related competence protein ComEC/Rec2 [Lachnospiraceae bacterium]|nr:DNA internalization-related competence protein ComEC/Rec2 [Lachnospiraceae bacterium]
MKIKRPLCLICGLFALLILLGTVVVPPPEEPYGPFEKQRVFLTGEVCAKQVRSYPGGASVLEVSLRNISAFTADPDNPQPLTTAYETYAVPLPEGALVQLDPHAPEPEMGSVIRVTGSLHLFPHATNPGEFDSARYNRLRKLDFQVKEGRILAKKLPSLGIRESMYQWRRCFEVILDRAFPPEEAGILKAMLLGDKTFLSEDTRRLYQTSGILHILAISGLHISILGMTLYRLLKRLYVPAFLAAPVCLSFILLFSMVIGGGISPTRAILMFALRLLADVLGRTADMLTSITLTLFCMLLEQPYYMQHAGFLLSFGAVLGIALLVPFLEELFPGKTHPLTSRSILPSMAIFLFTFPVLLWFYHTFSPYSFLLNLLVIPLMNVVLIDGVLVLLVGLISLSGGLMLAGFPDRLILDLYEKVCLLFAKIPGSLQICGQPPAWKMVAYYGMLFGLFLLFRRKKMPRISALLGILTLLMVFSSPLPQGGVQVTAIDVGQGLSVLVQNENGEAFLFDAGSTSKKQTGKYQILPVLKYLGVGKLRAVFLSHPDEDHISAMTELLEDHGEGGVSIGRIILPDGDVQLLAPYEEILRRAHKEKVPVSYASAGDAFFSGKLSFTCLNPRKGLYAPDVNEISQSWLLTEKKGGFSMLLTGDITGTSENQMLQRLREEMEQAEISALSILQVAHHGSAYSTPEKLLEYASPACALISCGEGNSYGHPHRELLERLERQGSRVFRTDRQGAVRVQVFHGKIRVQTYE